MRRPCDSQGELLPVYQNHGKWCQEYHFRPGHPEMLISLGPLDIPHEKYWNGKATDPSPDECPVSCSRSTSILLNPKAKQTPD